MANPKDLSFIDKIIRFPVQSKISNYVISMLSEPMPSIRELAAKIRLDPSLALIALKTFKSAFPDQAGEIRSIESAVQMLGLPQMRMVLLSYLSDEPHQKSNKQYVIDHLWDHSLAVAIFARELANSLKIETEGAFLAGLLHDVGKLAIYTHNPYEYEKIINLVDKEGGNYMPLEEETFGFSHIDTGYYLVNKWGLPGFIKSTILFHHFNMSYAGDDPVISLVAFANQLVHRYIDRKPVIVDVYLKQFPLSREQLNQLAESAMNSVSQFLSLPAPNEPPPAPKETTPQAEKEALLVTQTSISTSKTTSFAALSSSAFVNKDPQAKPGTPQPARQLNSSFGQPIVLDPVLQPSQPEHNFQEKDKNNGNGSGNGKRDNIKTETSADRDGQGFSDSVTLFLQLEKIKKELFELKKLFYMLEYVPPDVMRKHSQILKLFSESVNILIKDPRMSKLLKSSRNTRSNPAPKPREKDDGFLVID